MRCRSIVDRPSTDTSFSSFLDIFNFIPSLYFLASVVGHRPTARFLSKYLYLTFNFFPKLRPSKHLELYNARFDIEGKRVGSYLDCKVK